MQNFAAIDFETANNERTSICSIGVAIVQNGVIAERLYELVRPNPNYYIEYFTRAIHGLSRADTDGAPLFPVVWAAFAPKIEGLPLVAHNSPFDEGCLRAAHEFYNLPYPQYTFHCTCRAARRAFRDLPNHQLHTVSRHCGYELTNHHNAIADAEACAMIALKVL
ncbi:DNA polymerase III subunit epsilon [Campylobacterota bacterium]|nr:DNA polymerase III subunit epsilon [Campylobacterota bacterium]